MLLMSLATLIQSWINSPAAQHGIANKNEPKKEDSGIKIIVKSLLPRDK